MTDQKRLPPPKKSPRSALKRQRLFLLIAAIVVAVLVVSFVLVWIFTSRVQFVDVDGTKYFAARKNGAYVLQTESKETLPQNSDGLYITNRDTLVRVDEENGECTVVAVVLTADETETLKFNYGTNKYDILIYPEIEMDGESDATCIQSIEIKNKDDHFTFYRNGEGQYVAKDCAGITIDEVMIASLAVSTGYSRVNKRIDLSAVHELTYAEYGLPDNPDDAEIYYIITNVAGDSYKVIIGNRTPDWLGYYARLVGREDVYIISDSATTEYSASLTDSLVKAKLEDYAAPYPLVPMGTSSYFDVTDFRLLDGTIGLEANADGKITALTGHQLVNFTYIPLEWRIGTVDTSVPYTGSIGDPSDGGGQMASGYRINGYNVDDCLQNLQMMQGVRVVWLDNGRTDDLDVDSFTAKYGCAYGIEFDWISERNGEDRNYSPKVTIEQRMLISPETTDGTYYVYNLTYDMVVEVENIYFEFLKWQDVEWVETAIFSSHIGYVEKVEFQIANGVTVNGNKVHHVVFDLDNSKSEQSGNSKDNYVNTKNLEVFLTCVIGDKSYSKTLISTAAFRNLHMVMLNSSLEGDAAISEAEQEAYRNAGDSGADLVVRVTKREADGQSVTYVYRFYNYHARQTYLTINGRGSCYILHKQIDKLISDIGNLLSGKVIDYENPFDGSCECRPIG